MYEPRQSFIKKSVLKISDNPDLIKEINDKVIKEVGGTLSICYYKCFNDNGKNEIFFVVDTDKDRFLPKATDLDLFINKKLEYNYAEDDDVECARINYRDQEYDSRYIDITPFKPENIENIRAFFQKHYPHCFEKKLAVQEESKKRKSSTESEFWKTNKDDVSSKTIKEPLAKKVNHKSPAKQAQGKSPTQLSK